MPLRCAAFYFVFQKKHWIVLPIKKICVKK